MPELDDALTTLTSWLDDRNIPYMVIGGFAVTIWGEPRFTRDLDVTISVDDNEVENLINLASKIFEVRVDNPIDFVADTRILPIVVDKVPVDLILAALPYENEAIARVKLIPIKDRDVRICSPEDLILHKIVSPRARDQEDIDGIFRHKHGELDCGYLDPRVAELADALADPGMATRYNALKARWGMPR